MRFHFIREQSAVAYEHIPTCENVADILTKSVGGLQHKRLMDKLQIEGACWETICQTASLLFMT